MNTNLALVIVWCVVAVLLLIVAIINIRLYASILPKLTKLNSRIIVLEESAYIRGERGRFRRLLPPELPPEPNVESNAVPNG